MKFIAASLLAIAASAIHLKEGTADAPKEYGSYGDLPFPAPDCPERPSESDMEGATDEEIFSHIDQSGNGAIDAKEGFEALYCMVEWGYMEEDEAIFMYEFLGDHADLDENGVPGELDATEAAAAMETLDKIDSLPDCGEMPEGAKEAGPQEIFSAIDQDGNGGIDEYEGMTALNCAVEWGLATPSEAYGAFKVIAEHAGDDDLVQYDELMAAVATMDME